jgi:hypothetical protein
VSARLTALVAGFVAIALVLDQDVAPGAAFYHSWQYALALAVALALMAGYAAGAWRGHDGPVGRRLVLALAGLAVVDLAGLASGLLGPDTATIVGTPGTVAPIPVLGAAAFFAPGVGTPRSSWGSGRAGCWAIRSSASPRVRPSTSRRGTHAART